MPRSPECPHIIIITTVIIISGVALWNRILNDVDPTPHRHSGCESTANSNALGERSIQLGLAVASLCGVALFCMLSAGRGRGTFFFRSGFNMRPSVAGVDACVWEEIVHRASFLTGDGRLRFRSHIWWALNFHDLFSTRPFLVGLWCYNILTFFFEKTMNTQSLPQQVERVGRP